MIPVRVILAVLITAAPLGSSAAEPEVDPKDLPRVPATEPSQALSTFKIKPGFHLEMVASEPLVVDPIAISFDEKGRMFVVEMRDYSERREEHLGRIRMLEDTDGDGRYDKSTIYADNLAWPTAVICYDGGIFVGATPDIWYLKDTDGDGVADLKKVVFTGFGSGAPRLNVQALFNSFTWGLDNRIYGANGGNGGMIRSVAHPGSKPIELRGKDFSFDPRDLSMRLESGGGQYGLSFDSRGRKFVCSNSSHILAVMYEERYAARNPDYTMPAPADSIALDGGAAEVYRTSPDEPWRVIRTRWRVAGQVPGPIEGGGRASGYFTGATGITIYHGDAFPPEFTDDAFVADAGSNLVHRKKVWAEGIGLKAARPAGEEKVEFLASTDNWCRPVQLANAPDGSLYIIDMYREVIEHPWSLPQSIKKYLDLNSGNDRGRIYRVVPNGFKQRQMPPVETAAQLTTLLDHPNGWHRDLGARLIYERQDSSLVPILSKMVRESKSSLGRMHALYALQGLNSVSVNDILAGLTDPDPRVRQHAIRLAETFVGKPGVHARLVGLVDDPDSWVRYQLAFSLSVLEARKVPALTKLIQRDVEDTWMRVAVLYSVGSGAGELFSSVAQSPTFFARQGAEEFIRQLAGILGAERSVSTLFYRSLPLLPEKVAFTALSSLREASRKHGASPESNADVQRVFARAKDIAAASGTETATRIEAIRLVGQLPFAEAGPVLSELFNLREPEAVQRASLASLIGFSHAAIPKLLLDHWTAFTPNLRIAALDFFLRRPDRAASLLDAIEKGIVLRTELSLSQAQALRKFSDPVIRDRAEKLLGAVTSQRGEVIAQFRPALDLKGDAQRGKLIYRERCLSCHRLAGEGFQLGPDLESVKSMGKETLLANILDPSREVPPKYLNYSLETLNGESRTGLIASESDSTITLRQANGEETIVPRATIKTLRGLTQSAMPEGLEAGLTAQAMADLMAFILAN